MTETSLQAEVLRALGSRPDVRLFRNQVGQGWVGKFAARTGDGTLLLGARKVSFGLCPGSGDLIGWRILPVTQAMVGMEIAQFLSVEIKTPGGTIRPEQKNWWHHLNQTGARAVIARSVSEAEARV